MFASHKIVLKLFKTLDDMRRSERRDLTAADVVSDMVVTVQSTDRIYQVSDLMRTTGYYNCRCSRGTS